MDSLYKAPESEISYDNDLSEVSRQRRLWKRAIWVSISCVIIPPFIGIAGTIIGMIGAFSELAETGQADPQALANYISASLLSTLWGLGFSVIALIALVGALIRFFTLPKLPAPPASE